MTRELSNEDWQALCQAIYVQYRINQSLGKLPMVDVLATQQYADWIHQMIELESKANMALPEIIKWREDKYSVIAMTCRSYEAGVIIFPRCAVNVCIPDGYYKAILAVPNYNAGTYADILEKETRPFPPKQ